MAFCSRPHVRNIARGSQSQVMSAHAYDLSNWSGCARTHLATRHLTQLQVSAQVSCLVQSSYPVTKTLHRSSRPSVAMVYCDWHPTCAVVWVCVIVFCDRRTVGLETVLCWVGMSSLGGLVAAVEARNPCHRPSFGEIEVHSDQVRIQGVGKLLLVHPDRRKRKPLGRNRDRQSVVRVRMPEAKALDLK